jgi:putative Mn2+ efflux pump MntP
MYIWLKGFYPSYAVCMWGVFAVLFMLYGIGSQTQALKWLVGPSTGYLAGIVAYQLGPAIRDGSFVRSTSTVAVQGLPAYVGTSLLYPLLCLSPVIGMIAAVVLTAFTRRTDRYAAAAVVVVVAVFVIGWSFFLGHGALPAQW